MKNHLFNFSKSLLILVLFSQLSYSQLSNFTLTVTATNETCLGNGTLNFSVSNTTPGATILYSIFHLPNITTPIAVVSTNTLSGLNAGSYSVVATQSLGASSGLQQQNATIINLITPVVFTLTGTDENCHNGSITVHISQGNPVSYEILSGPIIVPPQASNVFNNLVAGTYNIRVNDNCGEGYVQTFTIIKVPYIIVSEFVKSCQMPDCNHSTGSFTINALPSSQLVYPLTVVFTYIPADGSGVQSISQTITSGGNSSVSASVNPSYHIGQVYYNIKVTDPCGTNFFNSGNSYSVSTDLIVTTNLPESCSKYISIDVCDFVPPYTVAFLSAPAGFVPTMFNTIHPGPFSSEVTTYSSTSTNNLPIGHYSFNVTDACGRVRNGQANIQDWNLNFIITNDDIPCNDLSIVYTTIDSPQLISLIITSAPTTFPFSLPYDAASYIINGYFSMSLAPGTYTFHTVDQCGITLNTIVVVPPTPVILTAVGHNVAGCDATGSIKIDITNSYLAE